MLSGSWSPDALIESLRPCRNQRGGEGGGSTRGRVGWGGVKTHIWHPRNPADSQKTSPRETYGPCSRWRLGRKRSAFVFPPLSQRRQESRTPTAPGKQVIKREKTGGEKERKTTILHLVGHQAAKLAAIVLLGALGKQRRPAAG